MSKPNNLCGKMRVRVINITSSVDLYVEENNIDWTSNLRIGYHKMIVNRGIFRLNLFNQTRDWMKHVITL